MGIIYVHLIFPLPLFFVHHYSFPPTSLLQIYIVFSLCDKSNYNIWISYILT